MTHAQTPQLREGEAVVKRRTRWGFLCTLSLVIAATGICTDLILQRELENILTISALRPISQGLVQDDGAVSFVATSACRGGQRNSATCQQIASEVVATVGQA